MIGFSSKALNFFSSKSPIYKIAYGGPNLAKIAVLRICLKDSSSDSKMLFFNNTSGSSLSVSFEIYLLSLSSKKL